MILIYEYMTEMMLDDSDEGNTVLDVWLTKVHDILYILLQITNLKVDGTDFGMDNT